MSVRFCVQVRGYFLNLKEKIIWNAISRKRYELMTYGIRLLVFLKEGVLDTQGKTVAASLKGMGYGCLKNLRVGKYVHLDVDAASEAEAVAQVEKMCDDLLVNDIIEEFTIEPEAARA